MRCSIIVSLCIVSFVVKGQVSSELLNEICSSELFVKHFSICKMDGNNLLLYDKQKVISQKSSIKSCEKKVIVTIDSIYNNCTPSQYNPNVEENLIILESYSQKHNTYTLILWRPLTNATIQVSYKESQGNRYKRTEYSYGDF